MEKKKKILKGVILVIIIIVIALAIHFTKNYIIITNIMKKQAENVSNANYTFITEMYSSKEESDKTVIEHYYKDGKNIMIKNQEPKIIIWYDEATQENIFQVPSTLKATIDKSPFILGNTLSGIFQKGEKMYVILTSIITNSKVDGKECYKVKYIGSNLEKDFSKEDGTLLKLIDGYEEIDGKKYDNITEFKNYTFDKLKDEDVSRPNLTGYEIGGL